MAIILVIAAIIILALLVKDVIIPAGVFVDHHLVLIIGGTIVTLVLFACFVRLLMAVLHRSVIMSWKPLPARPRRALPDPIDAAAFGHSRPFTLKEDPPPAEEPVLASAVLACEGPRCSSFLPEEQSMRWRIGTATTPQRADDEDFPEDTEDIHEFCSEACMNRWLSANNAPAGYPADPGNSAR